MRLRTPLTTLAAATAALALSACGGGNGQPAAPASQQTTAAFPVTVGSITVDKQPTKIVSLSPTATEMLFAIGAGKQVTAVDDQSNYPADAPKSDLSGFKPNVEAIAAKNPDLVVMAAPSTDPTVAQLTTLKIPVYRADAAKTLDDSYGQLTDLGKLTGHATEAADQVKRMKDDIAKITKDIKPRTKKLTYFHELEPDLYSARSSTFIGSVYALVGLANIADPATGSGDYPQLSAEAIIKANPDFIFLADTKCCQQNSATVKARPGWAAIAAVKNDRIVGLDDDIASRWGPRIVDLLRLVADAVAKVPAE
jgi:iron complex transport system substrate-binding protein